MTTKKVEFRSAYGKKAKVTLTTGEGLTEQHHKDEVDVNRIVARYNKTGVIDHLNDFEAKYADLTGYDYQDAQNTIAAANSMFEGLPSDIRKKFDNDPVAFLQFTDDPKNAQAMIDLGLARARTVEEEENALLVDGGSAAVEAAPAAETEAKA